MIQIPIKITCITNSKLSSMKKYQGKVTTYNLRVKVLENKLPSLRSISYCTSMEIHILKRLKMFGLHVINIENNRVKRNFCNSKTFLFHLKNFSTETDFKRLENLVIF